VPEIFNLIALVIAIVFLCSPNCSYASKPVSATTTQSNTHNAVILNENRTASGMSPASAGTESNESVTTLDATDTQALMKAVGKTVKIKGTVVEFGSVYEDNKRPIILYFLNKGSHVISYDDWQKNECGTDFKALLYKENFSEFPALDDYYNEEVIVEGPIELFKSGPAIFLRKASQLKYANKKPVIHNIPDSLKNSKIAFVSDRDNNPDPYFYTGDGLGEIYVMNPDGSNVVKLTETDSRNRCPTWSPDGKKIAFMSDRIGTAIWDIYVMNADGSNLVKLTKDHGNNLNPNWSPDGSKIAFASDFATHWNHGLDIYIMKSDGSDLHAITSTGPTKSAFAPVFSIDGSEIICTSNWLGPLGIIKINLASGDQTYLTQMNNKSSSWASLSPDGKKLVYASDTSSNINLGHPQFDLILFNLADSTSNKLTSTPADEIPKWNQYPDWSPDGTKIIFSSNRAQGIWQRYVSDDTYVTQLYVMDSDGGNVYRIPYIWGNNWDASWSPK
jgi:Tol biopolymer transport system component